MMSIKSPDRRSLLASGLWFLLNGALAGNKRHSQKKGFGIVPKDDPHWLEKTTRLNAGWFYTWGPHMPEPMPAGMEFIPMIWGRWNSNAATMKQLAALGHNALLGFNEPDQKNQSNMTVEEAIRLWPILMESGLRLGSPAGVHPDGEWMTTFMAEVKRRGYRVDFIAVHSYRGPGIRPFIDKLEKIRKLYDKPIWVTEFAVADWDARMDKPNRYSQDDVLRFMEAVLPELEKRDYIERYAWYSSPDPSHALNPSILFNADGSLNPLGQLYASI